MPIYTVGNRGANGAWNVLNGPPGPGGNRPRAQLNLNLAQSQNVAMGAHANVAFGPNMQGIYTQHLTDCSAFIILWRPAGANQWQRASLIHMLGGPDPNAVPWGAMLAGMGPGGTYYGILANRDQTVLSAGFVAAVTANTPIPAGNVWVYDAETHGGAIHFGVDWNGFAGEV